MTTLANENGPRPPFQVRAPPYSPLGSAGALMLIACQEGHLSVVSGCSRARPQTSPGRTTMASLRCDFCGKGDLSVCQWLFEVGASADITRAAMMASLRCTLLPRRSSVGVSVVVRGGASADITRANNHCTPCRLLAKKVICRCVSGCSRWARPQISPGRTIMASPDKRCLLLWSSVGVPVVVRGGRVRRHHQGGR